MSEPYRSFVIFAEMRTGSNHLEETLNEVPGLTCYGELFNPWFIGQENRTEMFDLSLEQRDVDPIGLIERMRDGTPGLPGFRFFSDHDPRVLAGIMPDRTCAKVILSRPPVESYVSMRIADATGLWRITSTAHREPRRIWFDPVEFNAFADRIDTFRADIRRTLRNSGQVPFEMTFPDILDVDVLNGLVRFLGLDHTIRAPSNRLKRQNPGPLRDKVTNPDEMEKTLEARGRRLPTDVISEAANVDGILDRLVATESPPLLYLPLPGGADAAVHSWMEAIGARPSAENPTDELSLRRWLNRTKQRRIFTVVSHPVMRAWRQFLSRNGDVIPDDPHADFLSYLSEAGLDPDTHPQCRILSSVSVSLLMDSILKADSLADELPRIAACPDWTIPDEPGLDVLASIYDQQIETAVRALYTPDYRAFGYRKWIAPKPRVRQG